MNREIYRKIARKHGVSVKDVKREMESAIDEVYKNPNPQAQLVCPDGRKPTIDELVDYISRKVKDC